MSHGIFILPFDPIHWKNPADSTQVPTSDLEIRPDEYQEAIQKDWPGTTFGQEPLHAIGWNLSSKDSELGMRGSLHSDFQVVSHGWGAEVVDFVLWHRAFVAEEHKLYLNIEGSWDSLELTSKTTADEIKNFLHLQ